jgi:hypothetical protein
MVAQARVAPMSLSELKGPGEWTELNMTNMDLRSHLKAPQMVYGILARDDVKGLPDYQQWLNMLGEMARSVPAIEYQINQLHSQHYQLNGKAISDEDMMSVIMIGQSYVDMRTVVDQHITIPAVTIVQQINDQLPEAQRVRLGD